MDCAVLHGVGGSFCAGFDLEELSAADEENISNSLAQLMNRGPMVIFLLFRIWLGKKFRFSRVPLEWSSASQ